MKHKCTTYNIQNSNVTYNSYYEKFADGTVKCIDDEIPFEVPNGWEWCRISSIIELLSGQDFIPEKYNSKNQGIPYITGASNIIKGKLIINRWTQYPSVIGKLGDLLIVCKGSGVGKMCFCNVEKIHIARQIQIIRSISVLTCLHYLKIVIDANLQTIVSNAQGVIPGISREHILNLIIPIPPKEEQIRIAEKVTTITPLIERYEIAQIAKEKLIFIMMNSLKKSILQSAIQGRLVPQDPNDEPASVLIERIRAEKERLIKEKKIKRDKNESVIYKGDDNSYYEIIDKKEINISDSLPFQIPNNWQWCRIKTVLNIWSARRVHERDWRTKGIPFYRAREIGKIADLGYVNNDLYIDNSLYQEFSKSGIPHVNDLMMTAVGTLGKTYIVTDNDPFYFKDGSVLCIGNYFLDPNYLHYFFFSDSFINQFIRESQGTTVGTLTMVRLNDYYIPIPPISEQHRITDKIKQLFQILK